MMAELEAAKWNLQRTDEMKQEDDPTRAARLNSLGLDCHYNYSRTGQVSYLEEAVRLGQEAVNATLKDHPDRGERLGNLQGYLLLKYQEMGETDDLTSAVRVAQEAVDAIPSDHPDYALYLSKLSLVLRYKSGVTSSTVDREEAVSHDQALLAMRTGRSSIVTQIISGRESLWEFANKSDWQRAYFAAQTTVLLIRELSSLSLDNFNKQYILGQVAGLASDAAAVALKANQGPFAALAFLEQGRGVLAASLEDMRMNLSDLTARWPHLAEQYDRLQHEIATPVTLQTSPTDGLYESSYGAQAVRRQRAIIKLEKVVAEIRQQSGFEDLLAAPSEVEVRMAAKDGPIVVINVSSFGCDAILVEYHQIRSLHLPMLNLPRIQEQAREHGFGSANTLQWLWDFVAHPILEALGLLVSQLPAGNSWPRMWWIPIGSIAKFPLHAAGYHTTDGARTVLDRTISSYSASIKAIIRGRLRPLQVGPSPSDQALLVSMRYTPGQYRELCFAAAEIATVRRLCESMGLRSVEPRPDTQNILTHLPQSKIFHFAGHGYTDSEHPSNSELVLEDGKGRSLAIFDLLEINLAARSPFLAYLSACGTGQIGNDRFIDESIHLISAFQFSGFRHVIGTLWEVDDELCVEMSRITYTSLRDGGLTDELVGMALHKASRELRDRWCIEVDMERSRRRSAVSDEHEITDRGASDGDHRDRQLPRDSILCDDDEESIGSLLWVPYVHFGI